MKAELILLTPKNKDGEHHLLEVYSDGRIICDCLFNIVDENRDICSDCKHCRQLKEAIFKGDISEYENV